jgi:hypothetical protein
MDDADAGTCRGESPSAAETPVSSQIREQSINEMERSRVQVDVARSQIGRLVPMQTQYWSRSVEACGERARECGLSRERKFEARERAGVKPAAPPLSAIRERMWRCLR